MTSSLGLPRPVEIVLAAATLVLLLPLLVVCVVLIRLTSGPGVLFRQQRMGRQGHPFTLLKFRTMRPFTTGDPQVTAEGDARITPFGAFMRRTKLDELPQLWNIVRGDMSFVGPRPEALAYVDRAEPRWHQVLAMRPGLTDPVTISLRNEQLLLAQVQGDREVFYMRTLQPFKLTGYLEYASRRSWRSDLRVLWDTAVAVAQPGRIPVFTIDQIESAVSERG